MYDRVTNILTKNDIHPSFHAEFYDLILLGVRPGKQLRTRLRTACNYKAALDEAMAALSESLPTKFPPALETTNEACSGLCRP